MPRFSHNPSVHALIAVVLANLPVRWWGPFEERFPVYQYAWAAGLATLFAGFAVGIPGFLAYLQEAASGANEALIGAQSDLVQVPGWALLALPAFLFFSPLGLFSLYLVASGLARFAASFITEDPHGDLLLTWLDACVRRLRGNTEAWAAQRTRERLEGPEVPDRVVPGGHAGRPECDLVVLASRRRSDWEANAYLVTPDGRAYRIGAVFDFQSRAGLRAAYPLTELKTGEAIRHSIPYELPRSGADVKPR